GSILIMRRLLLAIGLATLTVLYSACSDDDQPIGGGHPNPGADAGATDGAADSTNPDVSAPSDAGQSADANDASDASPLPGRCLRCGAAACKRWARRRPRAARACPTSPRRPRMSNGRCRSPRFSTPSPRTAGPAPATRTWATFSSAARAI